MRLTRSNRQCVESELLQCDVLSRGNVQRAVVMMRGRNKCRCKNCDPLGACNGEGEGEGKCAKKRQRDGRVLVASKVEVREKLFTPGESSSGGTCAGASTLITRKHAVRCCAVLPNKVITYCTTLPCTLLPRLGGCTFTAASTTL